MHRNDGTCYLCMKLHCDYSDKRILEEHHVVFGSAGRELSERYGLKVYLDPEHHRTGKESAHMNHEIARLLQADAQRAFIREYPNLDFLQIFGRNYIDESSAAVPDEGHDERFSVEEGFKFI